MIIRKEERDKIAAVFSCGQGQKGRNAGMGAAGRSGFRRRNGGIGAAGGVRGRVLRTQSVGAAAAEKITAAAKKVAGEEKRQEWGRFLLGSIRVRRD